MNYSYLKAVIGSKRVALWYDLIVILATAISKNGAPIRLTEERWNHIITSHLEINPQDFKTIMSVVENPDLILQGDAGELLAVKKKHRTNSYFVVPYKEVNKNDGLY